MIEKIKTFIKAKKWRPYVSLQAISLYIIAIVALSVAWSSSKVVQRNYKLQQQVSALQQEVEVAKARVENQKLLNQYYSSDAFLELAARRQLNKGAPNEKLLIVPKEVALSKLPPEKPDESTDNETAEELSNWQKWFEFLTGRAITN